MSTNIQPGATVQLKSGGPRMTVCEEALAHDEWRCIWNSNSGVQEAVIPAVALQVLSGGSPGFDKDGLPLGPEGELGLPPGNELPPKVLEVIDGLMAALNSYVCTLKYMKASVNWEEWESHGDWDKLARRGIAAMSRAELLKDG